ncbi:MAG: hypothetical protein P9M03_03760, partial [Candidatus Theseobacter exili]|nr:hypothetical protein [Candidatus Theseobacter exili]
ITKINRKTKKSNNKPYITLDIKDFEGSGEALLINSAYNEYKDTLKEDSLVLVDGSISTQSNNDQPSIFVNSIEPLENARKTRTRAINITLSSTSLKTSDIDSIIKTCERFPGNVTLWIKLITETAGTYRIKSKRCTVSPSRELIDELRNLLGREKVRIS